MRFYRAVCSLIEAAAQFLSTASLEREFEEADWAQADTDDD